MLKCLVVRCSNAIEGWFADLEVWEAVPIAGPLGSAGEAARIRRAGHHTCTLALAARRCLAAYEGIVLVPVPVCAAGDRGGDAFLRFEGVYYAARVWLNGVYLGDHEGYFSAFEFDVTDMVVTDGENDLLVEVFSPEEAEENDRKTIGGVWARWDGMAPPHKSGRHFQRG